jgi:uncharacterized protein (TIGR03067 family)
VGTQLVVGLALLVGAPATKPSEPDPLVGEWSLQTKGFNGGYNATDGRMVAFTVDGKFRSWKDDRTLESGTYKLVGKGDPARLDWTVDSETWKCIYKVDGDCLTICVEYDPKGDRPVKFAAAEESSCRVLTFKRLPPAKKR